MARPRTGCRALAAALVAGAALRLASRGGAGFAGGLAAGWRSAAPCLQGPAAGAARGRIASRAVPRPCPWKQEKHDFKKRPEEFLTLAERWKDVLKNPDSDAFEPVDRLQRKELAKYKVSSYDKLKFKVQANKKTDDELRADLVAARKQLMLFRWDRFANNVETDKDVLAEKLARGYAAEIALDERGQEARDAAKQAEAEEDAEFLKLPMTQQEKLTRDFDEISQIWHKPDKELAREIYPGMRMKRRFKIGFKVKGFREAFRFVPPHLEEGFDPKEMPEKRPCWRTTRKLEFKAKADLAKGKDGVFRS